MVDKNVPPGDSPDRADREPAAGDSTAAMPAVGPGDQPGDSTGPMPAVDPYADPDDDATAPISGGPGGLAPDATRTMPAVDPTAPAGGATPAAAPRWSARAEVPVAGAATVRQQSWEEVVGEDPYDGRSWFMPIIIGIVALLLIAALGIGVWLITRSMNDDAPVAPPEAPAPSVVASSARPSPSPSAAPPSAASPVPARVEIPRVQGASRADAVRALEALGLTVTVRERPDASAPAGTALGTDPEAGTRVDPGDPVTLLVATTPRVTTPSPAPAASGSPASG